MSIEFEVINKSESPPGGWRFTQRESGREFHHYAYQPFLNEIRDHRLANEYTISADWEAEIQDQLCRENSHWFPLTCRRIGAKSGPRRLSFAATISFLQMLGKWVATGAPYVEAEVAEERAAICSSCPHNVRSEFGCGNCSAQIHKIISAIGGKRSTSLDDKLHSCGICSCSLKSAVWFPLEAQGEGLSEDIKAELNAVPWCWKHYE